MFVFFKKSKRHAVFLPRSLPVACPRRYAYFIRRVRTHLHIVLAFSPIGDAFRERLRLFPSLINCCAIDWFTAWPADALQVQKRDESACARSHEVFTRF